MEINKSEAENSKKELNWLMERAEQCSERYIEAEKFILDLAEMPWYKRAFSFWKIMSFINSRQKFKF